MSILDAIQKSWRRTMRRHMVQMLLSERQGVPVAFVSLGHVTWVHQEGASDIGRIFIGQPDQRFAVVRERDGYCVYDFETAHVDNSLGRVKIDDPEIYPTEEAAVMAAMLRA